MRTPERGNILFLILLAVILFAALAYAVTSSMRGGGKDASAEKYTLLATQILENAQLMEATIGRAQLVNDIPDYGFDFFSGTTGIGFHVSNATCTQPACKIFMENGGSVPLLGIPSWASGHSSGNVRYPAISVGQIINIGTPANDVLLRYDWINLNLCNALNELVQMSGIRLSPNDGLGTSDNAYDGTLTALPASTGVIGDTNPDIRGAKAACYLVANGNYRFHYVLMER